MKYAEIVSKQWVRRLFPETQSAAFDKFTAVKHLEQLKSKNAKINAVEVRLQSFAKLWPTLYR